MDLALLEDRFAAPNRFKQDIIDYTKANNLVLDLNKTIAGVAYYHQKPVTGLTSETFFSGQFDSTQTNIRNSFERPQSEHLFIYGFRILVGTEANIVATDWNEGSTDVDILNATLTVVSNGVTQLRDYPVTEIKKNQTGQYYAYFGLQELITWAGQSSLSVDCNFQRAVAAVDTNMRIELLAVGFIS